MSRQTVHWRNRGYLGASNWALCYRKPVCSHPLTQFHYQSGCESRHVRFSFILSVNSKNCAKSGFVCLLWFQFYFIGIHPNVTRNTECFISHCWFVVTGFEVPLIWVDYFDCNYHNHRFVIDFISLELHFHWEQYLCHAFEMMNSYFYFHLVV